MLIPFLGSPVLLHLTATHHTGMSKFDINNPLRVVFSNLFSVFHLVMKHTASHA